LPIIYADNNATTQVAPEVLDAMLPYLGARYGNPSSLHLLGAEAAKNIDLARAKVADLLGAKPSEIVFNSGGTESDNAAIQGALAAQPKKRHIVTTAVEHPAVLNLAKLLATQGYEISYVPVDKEGRLDEERFWKSVRPDTCLVSVMWANNETGVLFPIQEMSRALKAKYPDVLFHTDAVGAVGKTPVNVSRAPVDLLSLSGHKFHAPKGIGALFVRRGVRIKPLIVGGQQEEGLRGGTQNAASIVALGKACEMARERLDRMNTRVLALRNKLEKECVARVAGAIIHGAKAPRVPNTASIGLRGLEAEALLTALSDEGICASSGSACKKGIPSASHVLIAMGVPREYALGTIRFSLGHSNTEEDVERIVETLPRVVAKLSAIAARVA